MVSLREVMLAILSREGIVLKTVPDTQMDLFSVKQKCYNRNLQATKTERCDAVWTLCRCSVRSVSDFMEPAQTAKDMGFCYVVVSWINSPAEPLFSPHKTQLSGIYRKDFNAPCNLYSCKGLLVKDIAEYALNM